MRTFVKFFIVPLLMMQIFDVKIYNSNCELQAHYYAEEVYVNSIENYADIILADGNSVHVPFKYGVRELQVSDQGFFRSYQYEDGHVKEYTKPQEAYCKGSV